MALAFDIETTGLDASKGDRVTIVCCEDWLTREQHAFEFERVRADEQATKDMLSHMCALFDQASSLHAFNGLKFDLVFLQQAFDLPAPQVQAWTRKTLDIFAVAKSKYNHTFSLNALCAANGISMKTSSGCEAINMAAESRWNDLREYCAMDVTILNDIANKRFLLHPYTHDLIDLAVWSSGDLFPEALNETPEQLNNLQVRAKTALLQDLQVILEQQQQDDKARVQQTKACSKRPDINQMFETDPGHKVVS